MLQRVMIIITLHTTCLMTKQYYNITLHCKTVQISLEITLKISIEILVINKFKKHLCLSLISE